MGRPGITVTSRKKLFEIMQNSECKDFDHKLNFMEDHLLKKQNYSATDVKGVKDQLHFLKLKFRAKWVKAKRTSHAFCQMNEKWLNATHYCRKQKTVLSGTEVVSSNRNSCRNKFTKYFGSYSC